MSYRFASVWAFLIATLTGSDLVAQNPFPRDLIPTRTQLVRLGLERQWMAVVPVSETERIVRVSRSQDLLFVESDHGSLHAYEAETGRQLWSADLGGYTPFARPVSANSFAVFGTSGDALSALDRGTGRLIWRTHLGTVPTCGTTCDEDRVMVGTLNGKLLAYSLKEQTDQGEVVRTRPVQVWHWQTAGAIFTLPLPAERLTLFGSSDGRVYAVLNDEPVSLYRFRTGGPIGDGLGSFGISTLLIPSADNNLYALNVHTSELLWTFPSGAPITQSPLVAGDDVFVINDRGDLSSLNPKDGSAHWTTSTHGAHFVAAGQAKLYLRSWNNDLYVIDRASGSVLADPAATLQRAGLNLRPYNLTLLNRFDDRLYFGTSSGMVICLREIGANQPRPLRDPKAPPFGHVPPEGLKKTPPPPPAAEPAAESADEPRQAEPDAEAKEAEPK